MTRIGDSPVRSTPNAGERFGGILGNIRAPYVEIYHKTAELQDLEQ